MRCKLFLLIFLLSTFIFSACLQEQQTSDLATLREISPGILEGYLTKDELPNSLKLLDPPPEEGSAAFNLDQEMAAKYLTVDEGRQEQAVKDAVLAFPEATVAFNMVLDVEISQENTPHLYILLRRTLADAGLSTYAAKNNYQRTRPFMINNQLICTPEEEEHLRKDGSYPSGHTAIGWAWALILTEVFPEKTDVILERGKQFGISRNICNVHWYSDVIAGRMMGAATVARLHANPVFLADLAVAKKEVTH